MTTTENPVLPADTPLPECEKCHAPMTRVEGTNVVNCNRCGTTDELTAPRETPVEEREAVQPDEVLNAGEARPSTEEKPDAPAPIDQNAALEAAVESALTSPGVPGRDEFLTLAQTARMLSMSPLVPKFLRGNPAACFHLAMIGRDLGISPTSAVELIDVMPEDRNDASKGGRPMLSPELLNGQVARTGLGSIVPLARNERRCVAVALAPGGALDATCVRLERHFLGNDKDYEDLGFAGGRPADPAERLPICRCRGIVGETEFTWEDAKVAGLVQTPGRDYGADHGGCEPGNHAAYMHSANGRSWTKCDCNQGYVTYPKRMLWWRASGFCQSDFMPQASMGLYSPEEMGAVVDEHGRMIDPSQVALPEGYGPPEAASAPEAEPATEEQRAEIRRRISELPGIQQAALKAEWIERKVEPVADLAEPGYRTAKTLLVRFESEAQREAAGSVQAAAGPPSSSDAQEGTEEAAGPQPPEGMAPDLAAQYGRPRPVLTEALNEGAATTVKIMAPRSLNDALRSRGLSVDGNEDDRGLRLARVLASESAQQDWDAANAKPAS